MQQRHNKKFCQAKNPAFCNCLLKSGMDPGEIFWGLPAAGVGVRTNNPRGSMSGWNNDETKNFNFTFFY